MNKEDRILRARMGAHALHARRNPVETTAAARDAFRTQFEREVIEYARSRGEELSPAEITRRAEHALKAHYIRMALASAKARRKARPKR